MVGVTCACSKVVRVRERTRWPALKRGVMGRHPGGRNAQQRGKGKFVTVPVVGVQQRETWEVSGHPRT